MMNRVGFVGQALRIRLAQSPALMWLGLLGLALGAMCAGAALARGAEIPPEGDLLDTATFNGAVGLFILTLAALAPGVDWTRRGRQVWAGLLVAFTRTRSKPSRPSVVSIAKKEVVLDRRFVLEAWAICRFLSNL